MLNNNLQRNFANLFKLNDFVSAREIIEKICKNIWSHPEPKTDKNEMLKKINSNSENVILYLNKIGVKIPTVIQSECSHILNNIAFQAKVLSLIHNGEIQVLNDVLILLGKIKSQQIRDITQIMSFFREIQDFFYFLQTF